MKASEFQMRTEIIQHLLGFLRFGFNLANGELTNASANLHGYPAVHKCGDDRYENDEERRRRIKGASFGPP